MVEYQIILNLYLPDGRTVKKIIYCSDRETGIEKFKYLGELVVDKNKNRYRELSDWKADNDVKGQIVNTEGLFGVSRIKILP